MPLEPGLFGIAAFASLAMAKPKYRPSTRLSVKPSRQQALLGGWLLLALSGAMAIAHFGSAVGIIAWIGQMCLAGGLLILLLSWKPRHALLAAGLAFLAGSAGTAMWLNYI